MSFLQNLCEIKKEQPFKIFLDMDGVICWWDKAFENLGKEFTKGLTGQEYEEKYGREALWDIISKHGKLDFWEHMPWKNDGKELWNYVKKYNPTILSTPAKNKLSVDGKHLWIDRELGKDVPRILVKDKYKYADTESILIDDFINKINDWINLGDGIGILHTSTKQTIEQLKQLGL